LDVIPTAMDFAGIPLPTHIDGKSLKPLLTGDSQKGPHDVIYSSSLHSTSWSYSYFGETVKSDRNRCPLYTFAVSADYVLLYVSSTPSGLYETYPDGLPSSRQMSDINVDPKQSTDITDSNTALAETYRLKLSAWLGEMSPPSANHQDQFAELIAETGEQIGDGSVPVVRRSSASDWPGRVRILKSNAKGTCFDVDMPGPYRLEVLSADGRTILTRHGQGKTTITAPSLSPGVYTIRLQGKW